MCISSIIFITTGLSVGRRRLQTRVLNKPVMVDNLAVKQTLFSRRRPVCVLPKPPDEYRLSVLPNVEIALIDQNESADWSGSAIRRLFSVVIMSSLSALLLAASFAPV